MMNIFVHWINENEGMSLICVSTLPSWPDQTVTILSLADPEIATPPLSGTILHGVTRKSLLELGTSWVTIC